MEIPVLVEPIPGKGFQAKGGEPFAVTAQGATREEAVHKLVEIIRTRIQGGAEVIPLEVAAGESPWMQWAGMFTDDALYDDWQKAIQERREALP